MALWLVSGCGDDACDELADICARCPDDATGRAARASCQRAVDSGDTLACEERVEQQTYAPYGCR